MKGFVLAILMSVILSMPANAVKLVWDPPNEGVPAGYVVYSKEAGSTDEAYSEPVGAETFEYPLPTTKFLPGKTYEFWVTAFNDAGESDPAGPVNHTFEGFAPPNNPPPIVIQIPSKVIFEIIK